LTHVQFGIFFPTLLCDGTDFPSRSPQRTKEVRAEGRLAMLVFSLARFSGAALHAFPHQKDSGPVTGAAGHSTEGAL